MTTDQRSTTRYEGDGTIIGSHANDPASERAPDPRAAHGVDRRVSSRRLAVAIAAVALIVVGAFAFQAWRMVEAIVQAEKAAVIAWPTREPWLVQAAIETPAPTSTATSQPTATLSGATATVTPPATGTTPVPSATSTPPQPTSTALPSPTATFPPLAQGPGETGRVSVVREILGAGVDSGDPGRHEVWGGRTSLNILIVGLDRRPDGGDQNADVIIIAHVDLVGKKVSAVSLPRDLLVEIPEIGPDKINSSYNYGVLGDPDNAVAGIAKVRDTIEYVFGVPLDGYVLIDFNGFKEVVESVDGIEVDVPYEIVDTEYPTEDYGTEVVRFPAGVQQMDGETALKYVRTRHADSDDARRERQFQVLLALFDKGTSFGSITKGDEIILALGQSVQTSFPLEQQLILARVGLEVDRSQIRLSVLGPPLLEPGYTVDGRWVYVGDPATIVAFVQDALQPLPPGQTADPPFDETPAN